MRHQEQKQQKAIPKRVAFVTLNEKYNGFRSAIAE